MAEWICGCGKKNPLRVMNCISCGCEIPRSEVKRIAKIELAIHVKEAQRKRKKKRQNCYKAVDCLTKWPLRAGMTVLAVLFFAWRVYVYNPEGLFPLMDSYSNVAIQAAEQMERRYMQFEEVWTGHMVGKASCFMKVKKSDEILLLIETGEDVLEERRDGLKEKEDWILQKYEEDLKEKMLHAIEKITVLKEKGLGE